MSRPHYESVTTADLVTVEGASGTLHHLICINTDTSDDAYISFYAASDAEIGTDPPLLQVKIPADDQAGCYFDRLDFGVVGLFYAVTATPTGDDTDDPTSAVLVSLGYS